MVLIQAKKKERHRRQRGLIESQLSFKKTFNLRSFLSSFSVDFEVDLEVDLELNLEVPKWPFLAPFCFF